MEVKNCSTCGKIFNSVMDVKRCSECRKGDEVKFKMIREYLYDNPGASIEEVSEHLDIDRIKILHFLREGRIETVGDQMVINCEHCGILITHGKYCEKCSREIAMDLRSAAKVIRKETSRTTHSAGMHIKKKK